MSILQPMIVRGYVQHSVTFSFQHTARQGRSTGFIRLKIQQELCQYRCSILPTDIYFSNAVRFIIDDRQLDK